MRLFQNRADFKNFSESSTSDAKSVDERFCLAVVSALANIEQHPATLSLLNIALNATNVDLRQSAAESLRGREATSYMPLLMANLIAPLDTTYSINVTSAGHVSLVQDVEQEQPQAVVREVYSNDFSTHRISIYQPVLDTTASTPMAVRKLVLGDETITTTLGHRFWVAGEGWQMAKFLEPDQRLFSMQGSLGLLATAAAEKTEVYNHVVGEYHTYFVGTSRLLVHDINCPQPTAMALPGVAQSNRRTLVE